MAFKREKEQNLLKMCLGFFFNLNLICLEEVKKVEISFILRDEMERKPLNFLETN